MKYLKYGIGLIGACAIVSASVVAPFSYADDLEIAHNLELAYDRLKSLIPTSDMDGGYLAVKQGSAYLFGFYRINYAISSYQYNISSWVVISYDSMLNKDTLTTLTTSNFPNPMYVYSNSIKLGRDSYSFDSSATNRVIAYSFPEQIKESQSSDNKVGVDLQGLQLLPFKRTPLQPMENTVDTLLSTLRPPVTEPPNTIPAPGFPNLPDDWVNGGGDVDIKIDLPDINFNLPDLPDYTLPSAPTIPEQFQTGISTVFGKIWDIVVQSGLVWLVVFSLTCSLIIYILSR